jgi:hypothetical protein
MIDPLRTPDASVWRNRKAIPKRKTASKMTRIFSKGICVATFMVSWVSLNASCGDITAPRLEIEVHELPGKGSLKFLLKYTGSSELIRSVFMRERSLTIPEIMLIGGTRVALGVGLGLLIGDKLSHDARKGAGWALLAVGVLTTIPLVHRTNNSL